jgi:hypothetical protein
MSHHNDSHDDLQAVIERLRADRPEASALELDAVKQRVRSRVARHPGRRARSAQPMKSRIAILATLVVGMVLSTAGAGLAISGFALSGEDASVAQYGRSNPEPPGPGVLGEEETNAPDNAPDTAPDTGDNEVAGESDDNPSDAGLQPTRQVEAGAQGGDDAGELPFTGFAAIPILIGGVALLSTGLVLRKRTGDDE